MIKKEQAALWNRITQFSIDDPTATVKFSDKLALHQQWSPAYTARVIEEYKKFVFLCCISPAGASPSQAVDEAWHLHLTYTQNYWKEFCPNVLGRELHHHPSKGGTPEKQRHFDWYAQTLHLYKEVFDIYPPEDIWPLPVPVEQPVLQSVLPFSGGLSTSPDVKYLLLLLVPFLIPFAYNAATPFQLDGPQFLVFFAGLVVMGLASLGVIYYRDKEMVREILERNFNQAVNPYQLSRYAFGRNRAVETAIVDLVERTILEPRKHSLFIFHPDHWQSTTGEQNPVIHHLLKTYSKGEIVSYTDLQVAYNEELTQHPDLARSLYAMEKRNNLKYAVIALVGIVWVARTMQGLVNDQSVGYLFAMAVFFGIAFAIIYTSTGPQRVFRDVLLSAYSRNELSPGYPTSSVVNEFAFFGISAFAVGYIYSDLKDTFRQNQRAGADAGGMANCGSSGCGSSCGSSCGGGCGGCGGGD